MYSREHAFDPPALRGSLLERNSEDQLSDSRRTSTNGRTNVRTDLEEFPVTSSPLADGSAHGSAHGPLRLTRRGRVLLLGALVGLLCAAFTLGRAGDSQASTDRSAPAPYASTTVHQGESLWAVAQRVAPGQDPRGLVQQLRELNELSGATVQVGQLLLIPHLS